MISRTAVCWLCFASVIICGAVPGAAQQATGTGIISGTVMTANGQPVPNAQVAVAFRRASLNDAVVNFNTIVTSDQNGKFSVPNVPSAKFALCPSAPGTALLNPCMWGPEPTVSVLAGQAAAAPALTMASGVDLYVRIQDPNGTLAASPGEAPSGAQTEFQAVAGQDQVFTFTVSGPAAAKPQ